MPAPAHAAPEARPTQPYRPSRRLLQQAGAAPHRPRGRRVGRALGLGLATVAAAAFGVALAAALTMPRSSARAARGPTPAAAASPQGPAVAAGPAPSAGAAPAAPQAPGAAVRQPSQPAGEPSSDPAASEPESSPRAGGAAVETAETAEAEPAPTAEAEPAPTAEAEPAPTAEAEPASAPRDRRNPAQRLERSMLELHRLLDDLDPEAVREVVDRQRPRFQRCYERALRRVSGAEPAKVVLEVRIDPAGEVTEALVRGDRVAHLHDCLRGLAQRWSFPPSRAGGRVPIPLSFAPRR